MDSNHSVLISFSMLEVYMGNLKDLLVPKPAKPTDPIPPCLSIQTDLEGGIEIDNLVAIKVNDFNQALRLYRLGCRFISTASTNSNVTSSRSHCMIRIAITCLNAPERRRETNKIWLVDLGGSERVLKTKAWGKRFDEGKAINLSLSALGDVINALQRKKNHIPYRNSKLTQILKDSLGNDSKTLMLVHISPKEEDLCETICSLNFATRAKSIHLGNEDTTEAREQKEVVMVNLQKMMKQIEEDHRHVRREIDQLNKKLENLTGIIASSQNQLDLDDFSTEESFDKNRTGDITLPSLSKLPRFMRPTICSRRRSGKHYPTPEETGLVHARKRRTSSHRAESVSFPVKNHSDCNSQPSVSKSSCLAGFNRKNGSDNATQYSQDTTETDHVLIDLLRQERAPRTSNSQKAGTCHVQRNSSTQRNENGKKKKYLNVDNWLHQQKTEPTISGHTHRTKRVVAVPILNKKHLNNGYSNTENFPGECMFNCEFKKHNEFNRYTKDILFAGGEAEKPISEAIPSKQLTTLKDLFTEDSRSDIDESPSHTSEGKTTIHTQDSIDSSSVGENQCVSFLLPEGCSVGLDEPMEYRGGNEMPIMQVVVGKIECPNNLMLKDHGFHESSPPQSDDIIIHPKQNSGISLFKLESHSHWVSAKSDMEHGERHNCYDFFQQRAKQTRPDVLHLSSQRALFMKTENPRDLTITDDKQKQENQTTGFWYALKQKVQVLCASTLLGLGVTELGLEHDFFYGLML